MTKWNERERLERLVVALKKVETESCKNWAGGLSNRKREEQEFHDRDRDPTRACEISGAAPTGNRKFYATAAISQDYIRDWIQNTARGRVFLDYACGNGSNAITAATAGARLAVGIDISGVSIQECKRRAEAVGVTANTYFVQGDCESTGLPDNSIDVVCCCGILHHLDLSYAMPELRRIMRPGARCLAMEALGYNPAIRLYRMLTPRLRTHWEQRHILTLKDLSFARRFFDVRSVRYWHLASILATPFRKKPAFRTVLSIANAFDAMALRIFALQLLAWQFSFELVVRKE